MPASAPATISAAASLELRPSGCTGGLISQGVAPTMPAPLPSPNIFSATALQSMNRSPFMMNIASGPDSKSVL